MKKRKYNEKPFNNIVIPSSTVRETKKREQAKYGSVKLISQASVSCISFQTLGAEDHLGLVRLFEVANVSYAQEQKAFQEGTLVTIQKTASLRPIRRNDRPFIFEFIRTPKGLVMYRRKPIRKGSKLFWSRFSTTLPAFGYTKGGVNCDMLSKLLHKDVRVNDMTILHQYRKMSVGEFHSKYEHLYRQQREAILNQNLDLFPRSSISIAEAAQAGMPSVAPQPTIEEVKAPMAVPSSF
jgi:hypothetical protein